MKVVVNRCYGGFSLSHEAVMLYAKLKGIKLYTEQDDLERRCGVMHYYKVEPKKYHELSEECKRIDGNYKRINAKDWYFSESDIRRDDEILVSVVEKLGKKANGKYANLQIVEIPDGISWEIDEYDGMETVEEKHRSW